MVAIVLAAFLTAVITPVATPHKRILFAHKVISFIDFGEAPLQYMLFFDNLIHIITKQKAQVKTFLVQLTLLLRTPLLNDVKIILGLFLYFFQSHNLKFKSFLVLNLLIASVECEWVYEYGYDKTEC